MVPSWPGSKDTAWWSERSQETAGEREREQHTEGERRKRQTEGTQSKMISEEECEEGGTREINEYKAPQEIQLRPVLDVKERAGRRRKEQ